MDRAYEAASAADRSVLVLDGDASWRQAMGRALASRGFVPTLAETVSLALSAVCSAPPAYAVIEPRLSDGSGMVVVKALHRARPDSRAVFLTSHGSIAAAVAALKAGVADYLTKPANPDDVANALEATPQDAVPTLPDHPMSADRVRWEHIQRVFELCDNNVSETARRLKMHRRSLQRILQKRAPR